MDTEFDPAVEPVFDDNSQLVVATAFDFSALDSIADEILEAKAVGGDVHAVIERHLEPERIQIRAQAVSAVLSLVMNAKRPALSCAQIAFAIGIITETGPTLASKYGVSKQDFFAGVGKFKELLGLKRIRFERSETGKEKNRNRNHRQKFYE